MAESYLSAVKAELQGIFDEAFRFTWQEVEKALKESYRNGVKAGAKGDGEKKSSGRRWNRGGSRENTQPG